MDLFAKKVSIALKDLNSRGLETYLNNEICAALKQKIFLNASLQLFLNAKISEVIFNAGIILEYLSLEIGVRLFQFFFTQIVPKSIENAFMRLPGKDQILY